MSSTTFFPLCVFHFHFKLKKASSKRHNPIHSYIFVLTDQDYVPTVTSEWLFLFVLYIYLFSDMQLKCLDPSFCMYCISQREWFKACRSVSKSICIKICLQWACFTEEAGGNGTTIYQRCERAAVSRVFGFEIIMQESRLVSANHKNEKEFQQRAEKTNKH